MDCIFCKIINNEIKTEKVYEDDLMIIINDIAPQAQKHYLMIPKEHYKNVAEMTELQSVMLGKCLKKVGDLKDQLGLQNGFRVVSNAGENGCQSVMHLHFHILGGEKLCDKMG